jgi:hypothetical protein
MADVTVQVGSDGNATNPGVKQGQTIQWVLDSGVDGPFALNPPLDIFERKPACFTLSSETPESPKHTVKGGCSTGEHQYTIVSGTCQEASQLPTTGTQKITVNTSMGASAAGRT